MRVSRTPSDRRLFCLGHGLNPVTVRLKEGGFSTGVEPVPPPSFWAPPPPPLPSSGRSPRSSSGWCPDRNARRRAQQTWARGRRERSLPIQRKLIGFAKAGGCIVSPCYVKHFLDLPLIPCSLFFCSNTQILEFLPEQQTSARGLYFQMSTFQICARLRGCALVLRAVAGVFANNFCSSLE